MKKPQSWDEAMRITHFPPRARQLYSNLVFSELGLALSCAVALAVDMRPHWIVFALWLNAGIIRFTMKLFYKPWEK